MLRPSFRQVWSAIDDAPDPAAFVRFMDALRRGDTDSSTYEYDLALLSPEAGMRVLDLGCVTGGALRSMAAAVGPSGRLVGVDKSATMITAARERTAATVPPVEYRVADGHDLPFDAESFDLCISLGLFHLLDDPQRVLAEMVRVLRPGGRLIIEAGDADMTAIDATDRELTKRIVHYIADEEMNGWIGRRLPGMCREVGLKEVTVRAFTAVLTDFDFMLNRLGMGEWLARAAEAGAISADVGEVWLADLRARNRDGRFLAYATTVIFMAEKPLPALSLGVA